MFALRCVRRFLGQEAQRVGGAREVTPQARASQTRLSAGLAEESACGDCKRSEVAGEGGEESPGHQTTENAGGRVAATTSSATALG